MSLADAVSILPDPPDGDERAVRYSPGTVPSITMLRSRSPGAESTGEVGGAAKTLPAGAPGRPAASAGRAASDRAACPVVADPRFGRARRPERAPELGRNPRHRPRALGSVARTSAGRAGRPDRHGRLGLAGRGQRREPAGRRPDAARGARPHP